MPHAPFAHATWVALLCLLPAWSAAQAPATDPAQRDYDRAIAACNGGSLPTPAREACVRDAGAALDRARGGTPPQAPVTSRDGRATVVAPEGARAPSSGSETATSRDGRATIVLPAGR